MGVKITSNDEERFRNQTDGFALNQRGRQGEIMLDGSIIGNVGLKLYTYTRVS